MKLEISRLRCAALIVTTLLVSAPMKATANAKVFRWDIITFNSQGAPIPGGQAVALADNVVGAIASMTLTGSGTFDTSDVLNVTGGGTFVIRNFPEGSTRASGTYEVTRLVQYIPSPEIPGTNILGGLAILAIRYSDGSEGIIVVNCGITGPPQQTEGVTTTKGDIDYWSIQGGNTLFHVGTTF